MHPNDMAEEQTLDTVVDDLRHAERGDLVLCKQRYMPNTLSRVFLEEEYKGTEHRAQLTPLHHGLYAESHDGGITVIYAMGFARLGSSRTSSGTRHVIYGGEKAYLTKRNSEPELVRLPAINTRTGKKRQHSIGNLHFFDLAFGARLYVFTERLYVGDRALASLAELGIPEFTEQLQEFAAQQMDQLAKPKTKAQ